MKSSILPLCTLIGAAPLVSAQGLQPRDHLRFPRPFATEVHGETGMVACPSDGPVHIQWVKDVDPAAPTPLEESTLATSLDFATTINESITSDRFLVLGWDTAAGAAKMVEVELDPSHTFHTLRTLPLGSAYLPFLSFIDTASDSLFLFTTNGQLLVLDFVAHPGVMSPAATLMTSVAAFPQLDPEIGTWLFTSLGPTDPGCALVNYVTSARFEARPNGSGWSVTFVDLDAVGQSTPPEDVEIAGSIHLASNSTWNIRGPSGSFDLIDDATGHTVASGSFSGLPDTWDAFTPPASLPSGHPLRMVHSSGEFVALHPVQRNGFASPASGPWTSDIAVPTVFGNFIGNAEFAAVWPLHAGELGHGASELLSVYLNIAVTSPSDPPPMSYPSPGFAVLHPQASVGPESVRLVGDEPTDGAFVGLPVPSDENLAGSLLYLQFVAVDSTGTTGASDVIALSLFQGAAALRGTTSDPGRDPGSEPSGRARRSWVQDLGSVDAGSREIVRVLLRRGR